MLKKKSFLERLSGGIRLKEDEEMEEELEEEKRGPIKKLSLDKKAGQEEERELSPNWDNEEEEAELTIDVYETASEIIVQTMVAGVQPDNLNITITRDSVTIKGKREENKSISGENYYVQELYWGAFSRTINLPEEVDPEEAEAVEKHGLLIIRLPKLDKNRETKLKIKSI